MLTLKCIWIEELPELLDTASYLTKILKLNFFFFSICPPDLLEQIS